MILDEVTGIVLAGGKSSRMGTDKALLSYEGETLISKAVQILGQCCQKVVISAKTNRYTMTGYEIWYDEIPVDAAITGIYSCLKRSETPWNFVISCDMPLIDPRLFEWLFEHKHNHEVVLPLNQKQQPEPLCGIYNKSVLPLLECKIQEGRYGLTEFVKQTDCMLISVPAGVPFYSPHMFVNINTPGDFNLLKKG